MKDLTYILRRMLRRGWMLAAAVLLTAGQCLLKLRLPKLMEAAVNEGVLRSDLSRVYAVGRQMLWVCLAMGAIGYGANLLCAVIAQRAALRLRNDAYRHVSALSVNQVNRIGQGTLINCLTTDIDVCAALINAMILLVVEPVLLAVGGIAMMWRIAPILGQVFAGFAAMQLIVMALFIRSTAPGFAKVRQAMDAMNSRLQSAFAGFRLTKVGGAQAAEQARFDERNQEMFDRTFAVQRRIAFFNPLVMLIMNLAVASVLALSGFQVASGAMNVGRVLSAITYSEQILLSIMAGGQMYRRVTEAQPSAKRLRRILDEVPEAAGGDAPLDQPFRSLTFEGVGFAYAGGGDVLRGVNLRLGAGERVALIGPIGSGKTTVAGLCARLFDATSGRVTLNGEDIRHWRIEDARRTVALVEKQSAVLEDTVRENVRFGRDGVTPGDIDRAVAAAQLADYLADKPEGLQTPLASMGRSLSGGERQRLTIARALAGNPGLLVLDDATSALDYATERALLAALRREYPDMALLLITNRLASARQADRIILLDGGRVEAEGADAELRQGSALYRRICEIQEG